MKLNNFLKNNICKACDKPLDLYMQTADSYYSNIWKASQLESGYEFKSYRNVNPLFKNKDDFFILEDNNIVFSSSKMKSFFKRNMYRLFYLCGDLRTDQHKYDSEIYLYDICYYRSFPEIEYDNQSNDKIKIVGSNLEDLAASLELFTFKKTENNKEKVYHFYNDICKKMSYFTYYVSDYTNNEEADPTVFEKTFSLLDLDVSLKNRENLLFKMDSWVLMG